MELQAPPNGDADGLQNQNDCGEGPHEHQNAKRRHQEPIPDLVRWLVSMIENRCQLDGQDRQNAGHDIQDQTAKKGKGRNRQDLRQIRQVRHNLEWCTRDAV